MNNRLAILFILPITLGMVGSASQGDWQAESSMAASVQLRSTFAPATNPAMGAIPYGFLIVSGAQNRESFKAPSERRALGNSGTQAESCSSVTPAGLQHVERTGIPAAPPDDMPDLNDFVAQVKNGEPSSARGLYVPNILAFAIAQQPAGNSNFISREKRTVTLFRMAAQFGAIGLVAHNYLAGALFFDLSENQSIDIIYGDGSVRRYCVARIRRFRALEPTDPFSPLVDLDDHESVLSSSAVFEQIYAHADRVVLQTCIGQDGDLLWGRMFVIALPLR